MSCADSRHERLDLGGHVLDPERLRLAGPRSNHTSDTSALSLSPMTVCLPLSDQPG